MISRSLGHRAPLLWLVLPFMAGLMVGKRAACGSVVWPLAVAVVTTIAAVVASWNARWLRAWPPAMVSALFSAGLATYALQRARVPVWDALPAREAQLVLAVERVFPQADAKRATGLARVGRAPEHLADLTGQRLYFSLTLRRGESAPIRSSVVSTIGVLITLPPNPPSDTFDGYLAGAGMNFRLTRGRVLGVERPAHAYYRFCADTAAHFSTILGGGIAEKRPALAGLLRALMLGATHELSDEQHTLFMQSGTMHLFAISGLNIGVIAGALQALLLLLRLRVWPRFVIGLTLLWLFVDITGASPSAVRAFVMAAFLQAAFVLRRPANPLAALVLSAFVVLLVSPLQVFSTSFQMSYAIVAALLLLGLPLGERWQNHWSPWRYLPKVSWRWWQHGGDAAWRATALALAIGVATTLVSMITGVQFFGLLTPGALLANLLLIPAAAIVTLGGFGSLLCGIVGFETGASLCNHAGALVLWGIEALVRASVQVPGALLPAQFIAPWIGPTALFALLVTLFVGYATGWKPARWGWLPPFVIVASTLLFGIRFP